jgi:hypothetical protein
MARATDTASNASAQRTKRRSPRRSIKEAAKGPMQQKRAMLIAIAKEMEAFDQPNSFSSGIISTPGVARIPAVTSSTRKVEAATIHA